MPGTFALFLIGIIIVIGLLAKYFFIRYKIPDVVVLITLGALFSHFGFTAGLDSSSTALSVLLDIALIYVVFNGALPIRIKAVFSSANWAFISATLNFISITTIIAIISYFLGFKLQVAIAIGMLLSVMDGSIINSILEIVPFSKVGEAFIQLESAIVDIFVIVGVIAMVHIQEITIAVFFQQLVNFILLSTAIGVAAGIGWASLSRRIGTKGHLSIATLAMLLLVYWFAEQFAANGVIAVFACAITIGNIKQLAQLMYRKKQVESMHPEQRHFFSEFSFILRTLLFFFIGTLIDFKMYHYLLLGLLLVMVAIIVRAFLFKIIYTKGIPPKDVSMMEIMAAKGMTPVVLILKIQETIGISSAFTNTVIGAIFSSVLLTAMFIPLIEHNKFVSVRSFFMLRKKITD